MRCAYEICEYRLEYFLLGGLIYLERAEQDEELDGEYSLDDIVNGKWACESGCDDSVVLQEIRYMKAVTLLDLLIFFQISHF